MAVVAVARYRLLNGTVIDRLINRTILWGLAGVSLTPRPHAYASLSHQLLLGCIVMIVAGIYGIVRLWSGDDPATARHRQRRYDLACAVVAVAVLIAGTPARRRGLLIDQTSGWDAVVLWTLFEIPIVVTAIAVLRLCLREFRTGDVRPRERLLYYGICAAAAGLLLDAGNNVIAATIQVLTHSPSIDPEMIRKAWTFLSSAIITVFMSALPVADLLLTRLGWDRIGRYCRRLTPLWRDLTAAVPEIRLQLDDGLGVPESRLHRMTVEIRDALLRLRPYLPDEAPAATDPGTAPSPESTRAYAVRIAAAASAKLRGLPPRPVAAVSTFSLTAHDHVAELQTLLALAREWPHARLAATEPRP